RTVGAVWLLVFLPYTIGRGRQFYAALKTQLPERRRADRRTRIGERVGLDVAVRPLECLRCRAIGISVGKLVRTYLRCRRGVMMCAVERAVGDTPPTRTRAAILVVYPAHHACVFAASEVPATD